MLAERGVDQAADGGHVALRVAHRRHVVAALDEPCLAQAGLHAFLRLFDVEHVVELHEVDPPRLGERCVRRRRRARVGARLVHQDRGRLRHVPRDRPRLAQSPRGEQVHDQPARHFVLGVTDRYRGGVLPASTRPASTPVTRPSSWKSRPTSNNVPRSGAPGMIVNTGMWAVRAVAIADATADIIVLSPPTNSACAPREASDCTASTMPEVSSSWPRAA